MTLTALDIHQLAAGGKAAADKVLAHITNIPDAGIPYTQEIPLSDLVLAEHQCLITIGGDVYQGLDPATGTQTTANSNIAFVLSATAGASRANLYAAIMGTADALHATLLNKDGDAPAPGIGTERVHAKLVGTSLVLCTADTVGGDPVARAVDGVFTLSANFNVSAAVWSNTRLNTTPGQAPGVRKYSVYQFAPGTRTTVPMVLAYTPDFVAFRVRTAAGVTKVSGTGTLTISGSVVTLTTGDIGATDIVTVEAWGDVE